MKKVTLIFAVMAASFFAACSKDDDNDYGVATPPAVVATVVSGTGDIAAKLTEFRNIIGAVLNSVPGAVGGRREVNWDGVPPVNSNNNTFPADFFNSTDPAVGNGRKRGLVYANNGAALRVDSTDFAEIEASYAAEFDAFSPKRTLISVGTTITEAIFKIPGSNTDASIKGFGVIFTDVDDANSTSLEFFNGTKSLGVFKVPAKNGSNFSFLGVHFPNDKITRVKIKAGNGVLGTGVKDISNGGTSDLVVMDDFLYDEPKNN